MALVVYSSCKTVANFIENAAAEETARRASLTEAPNVANAPDSDGATNQETELLEAA